MVPATSLQLPLYIIRRPIQHNLKCRKCIPAIATVVPKPQLIQATRNSIWEDLRLATVLPRQPIVTRNNPRMPEVSTGMLDMDSSLSNSSQAASN